MDQLQTITLDPRSDLVGLTQPVGLSPPEITAAQAPPNHFAGLPGFSASALAGFSPASPGTYQTYRQISSHPTNALVRGMIAAPIIANTWRWKKRRDDVPDDWISFARSVMDPMRQTIVGAALRALEFGWAGFEKIWEIRNGRRILARLKPLLWDYTDILLDDHGNVRGLRNCPPGERPVVLTGEKYFLYTYDAEAGNPYGRSRHENIRAAWAQSEEIRQRLAQYMKKVSGIIVQLHYPEGTTRDSAGAERPNQWLGQQVLDAVSAGRSVMFPNGFASTADLHAAYELAGKSPWQLSAFEAGGADHAAGFKLILEYYDALIFRGWLRPERSGLEAVHGSRADAQTHTDSGTLDSELIDRDLADAITRGVVDDLLFLNFGTAAHGSVAIEPAPIEADAQAILGDVLTTLLTKGDSQVAARIDANALLDQLCVPRAAH